MYVCCIIVKIIVKIIVMTLIVSLQCVKYIPG